MGNDTQAGKLCSDGTILWDEFRKEQRLKLKTFDNPNCLTCKILPLCMGYCSQKMLETGKFNNSICSKHSIDVSIKEYLALEFEMRYYLENIK